MQSLKFNMTKLKLLIIALFLLPQIIVAQSKPELGVKAGLNYTNNKINENTEGTIDNRAYKPGYYLGVFANFGINDKFSFSPELQFSNKGFKSEEYDAGINDQGTITVPENTLQLNYLNVSTLLAYDPIENLSILVGPEFGYRLSAKIKEGSQKTNVEEFYDQKWDVGAAAGAKYSLMDNLALEFRYTHGFSSIIKELLLTDALGQPTGEKAPKFQNRTFQLGIAYRFL